MRARKVAASLLAVLLAACTAADGGSPAPAGTAPDANRSPAGPAPSASPAEVRTPAGESPGIGSPPPAGSPSPAQPSPAGSSQTGSAPASSPAAPFDPQRVVLGLEDFASGLDGLTFATHAGDGSGVLYAVEQRGTVAAVDPSGTVAETPFLDIRDRVQSGGEQGLLGLAFHPDFANSGRLFVNYTDVNGNTVVSEFRAAGGTADPASERILLQVEQPFRNHNGGMVAFGPDGYLYISTGDGGGANDPLEAGQDLGTLLGKILRVDVDGAEPYAIPTDNPFAAAPDVRPEIWAYGLRNPWRFSFDRQTGSLFIADVGQNRWEEINAEPAAAGGRNYGWNVMEGPECLSQHECDTAGLTMPAAWYRLADGNCAVTGGYVYRGQEHVLLAGAYLFADYCSGRVWALDARRAVETGEAPITELAATDAAPTSFAEDEMGELFVVSRSGTLARLTVTER